MKSAEVADALGEVYDPELGIDIVSLGLVYAIDISEGHIRVDLTMTSEHCPMGGLILEGAGQAIDQRFPGSEVEVHYTADPPWDPRMLDGAARRRLGLE